MVKFTINFSKITIYKIKIFFSLVENNEIKYNRKK